MSSPQLGMQCIYRLGLGKGGLRWVMDDEDDDDDESSLEFAGDDDDDGDGLRGERVSE